MTSLDPFPLMPANFSDFQDLPEDPKTKKELQEKLNKKLLIHIVKGEVDAYKSSLYSGADPTSRVSQAVIESFPGELPVPKSRILEMNALHLACWLGHSKIINHLLQRENSLKRKLVDAVTPQGDTCLHLVARTNKKVSNRVFTQLTIASANLEAVDSLGYTVLHLLVEKGDRNKIIGLVNRVSTLNKWHITANTGLDSKFSKIILNYLGVKSYELSRLIDLTQEVRQRTPLALAVVNKNRPMVELLVQLKANPLAIVKHMENPISVAGLARDCSTPQIVQLLERYADI